MAEMDANGLFAIDVDADDYAETATVDTPSAVDRTFQSEADFQKQKASYSAKVDQGNLYAELVQVIPDLDPGSERSGQLVALGKRDVQLLEYAVGEMYYDRKYEEILELCGRVRELCDVEAVKGLRESLGRWEERCRARIAKGEKAEER
ncbi:hypothetical protein Slin15195_G118290 [Septoria linicola]|uniref:Uncharacterized protein n=1 Tax=Septoria linicola TaxID=215465 RepID=A0A9Q9B5B0_9PEZI|nr:hypothetical protein Slin14017_G095290 [Septoria linicola]USW58510.1 hypothetical protein Slin15195_G118290 [Septoria linicola]